MNGKQIRRGLEASNVALAYALLSACHLQSELQKLPIEPLGACRLDCESVNSAKRSNA